MAEEFLIPKEKYLASGIHIGMKQRTKQMEPFIYKVRSDGLAVMNLKLIDERIKIAAKFLANSKKILIVSRKSIAHQAIEKFSEIVGAKSISGRFMPGMLTNPDYENFYEVDIVFVVDPMADYQVLDEAIHARVPVVAICDTFNETGDVDFIIPANNKGIRSLTLLFWILAREILKERGEIKSDEEFKYKLEDFAKKGAFDQGTKRKRITRKRPYSKQRRTRRK
jgi:small subunit ribosomal protein S2